VLEDKIASKANLVRKGIRLVSNICRMCREEEKTTSHFFLARVELSGLCALEGFPSDYAPEVSIMKSQKHMSSIAEIEVLCYGHETCLYC